MSNQRVPRGRRRRSNTIGQIVQVLGLENELSFKELRIKTGISKRALSQSLKELIYLSQFGSPYLNREITDDNPPKVYYSLLLSPNDDRMNELENDYEEKYYEGEYIGAIESVDYINFLLGELDRDFLRSCISVLEGANNDTYEERIVKIVKSYFQRITRASYNDLANMARIIYYRSAKCSIRKLKTLNEQYRPRQDWERCDRCHHGRIDRTLRIRENYRIKCTRFHQITGERLRHPRDYVCVYFEP